MRNATLTAVAVAATLVGATAACTSDPVEPSSGPAFEAVECPDDVEVLVVPEHQCGYVTPTKGGPLRIFVVSVEPPVPSDLSPVLETGVDLGMTPTYGGLAPIAQRTGRRLFIVDLPGIGHSEPSLDCPEVDALGDEAIGRADDVIAAIAACRERVRDGGLDPTEVTPERLGEALYAVMEAFSEPSWVVLGHGTTAEAGRRLAVAHPDRVEAVILDSMVIDPDAEIDEVVEDVALACREDAACARTYGDPARTWARAKARLARRPLEVDVQGTLVSIDDATLERGVRWLVAPSALGPQLLPAMLAEAAAGRPGTYLQLFAGALSVAPPLCVGYVPKCESTERLVVGSVLSAMCPTLADVDAWAGACEAWGVPASDPAVEPLTGVPTLALFGSVDPFASPEVIHARLAELVPEAFLLEYRAGGHNVLGSECPRTARNPWLAGDVHDPPQAVPCLTAPIDFRL